jgi:hypothetical protein
MRDSFSSRLYVRCTPEQLARWKAKYPQLSWLIRKLLDDDEAVELVRCKRAKRLAEATEELGRLLSNRAVGGQFGANQETGQGPGPVR